MRLTAALLLVLALSACYSWGLSEADQKGIEALTSQTLQSLCTGSPPLADLFSSQGSAAVVRDDMGFAAGTRTRLKSDVALAARFKVPPTALATPGPMTRAGQFVFGTLQLRYELPVPPAPRPLRTLWDAFFRPSPSDIGQGPPAPVVEPATAELSLTFAAIKDGPKGSWRHVSFCLAPVEPAGSQEEAGAVVGTLLGLERVIREGDMKGLEGCLNPDPFVVAAHTPDGMGWFFTSPADLTAMLGVFAGMAASFQVPLPQVQATVSGPVATATGVWNLDVPMYGALHLGLSAVLIKPKDQWMLVSLCAGQLAP